LIFSGRNESKTECLARRFCDDLLERAGDGFDVRGPAAAVIPKIKDRFRFSSLCFSKNVSAALEVIAVTSEAIGKYKEISVAIDVDPVDML
jgi:primosomal protein N'